MARPIVLNLGVNAGKEVQLNCMLQPCKPLSQDLDNLLADSPLATSATWSYVPAPNCALPAPEPLTVLHTLSGGVGPDVMLLPDVDDARAEDVFKRWHQAHTAGGQCIIIRFPACDLEFVLVPVMTTAGGVPCPCYRGYTVSANMLPQMAQVIHFAKLMVVLDIDQTLLMAQTLKDIQARLDIVTTTRKAMTVDLAAAAGAGDTAHRLKCKIEAAYAEEALLQQDIEMLSSFQEDAGCRVCCGGEWFEPSWEPTMLSTGVEVTRPVVRLEVEGRVVIFTRTFPEFGSTSILIRPRPEWESLRAYLSGEEDLESVGVKKERWDVRVCTTAEREYAWEAWQLLDPTGSIFPHQELAWRMLCVNHPQKKDLLNVLRKQDIDAAVAIGAVPRCASDVQLVTDEVRAQRALLGRPVPLCVVVDDRPDVWEEDSRQAVMQVVPFHPYEEAAALMVGREAAPPWAYQRALDSEAEMLRVIATLKHTRSIIYKTLDMDVKAQVLRITKVGIGKADQLKSATGMSLVLPPLPSVPQLLAGSPYRPPATLGIAERGDQASAAAADVEGDGQRNHAAAAAAAGQAGGRSDTRKRPVGALAASAAAEGGAPDHEQQPAAKQQKQDRSSADIASSGSAIECSEGVQQQQQGSSSESPIQWQQQQQRRVFEGQQQQQQQRQRRVFEGQQQQQQQQRRVLEEQKQQENVQGPDTHTSSHRHKGPHMQQKQQLPEAAAGQQQLRHQQQRQHQQQQRQHQQHPGQHKQQQQGKHKSGGQ